MYFSGYGHIQSQGWIKKPEKLDDPAWECESTWPATSQAQSAPSIPASSYYPGMGSQDQPSEGVWRAHAGDNYTASQAISCETWGIGLCLGPFCDGFYLS